MRRAWIVPIALAFAALLLVSACGGGESAIAPTLTGTLTPGATQTPTATTAPTLTPGSTQPGCPPPIRCASTLDKAAEIAGYPVSVPRFLPPDFVQDEPIFIRQRSFGEAAWQVVTQTWRWSGDPSVALQLEQSPKPFQMGGETEPIDINGIPGTRPVTEAQPSGTAQPILILSWTQGEFTYLLNAWLLGPLTEEVVLQIAASVETQ